MAKDYDRIDRRQIINFKQLLKLKCLNKARKVDQEHTLKAKSSFKIPKYMTRLQNEGNQSSLFKLPLGVQSF
jgi:hypothetical protein